jgi:type IX secretion system PorP/SprF family membrane protein
LGTKIGYANQQINFSGLEVRDKLNDAFYIQLLESQQGRQNSILLDFGTVLYSKSFLISLSTQNLVTPKLSGDPILENINLSRYTIYSAGNFPLGAHVSMSPAVKINYAQDYDLEWAASTRFRYKEMIIFGGSYDSNSKVSALLGFNSSNFQLNYSYDFYLSDLRSFNVSVHEVVVGFLLNNRFGIQPRFW